MRYARLAQTMATAQIISITWGRLTFKIRINAARAPIATAGKTGALRPGRDVRERVGKRQAIVAGHGEHEPDRCGVDCQGANEDGEDHIDAGATRRDWRRARP